MSTGSLGLSVPPAKVSQHSCVSVGLKEETGYLVWIFPPRVSEQHHDTHTCKIIIWPEHRGRDFFLRLTLFAQNTVTQQPVIQKKSIPHPVTHRHHSLPPYRLTVIDLIRLSAATFQNPAFRFSQIVVYPSQHRAKFKDNQVNYVRPPGKVLSGVLYSFTRTLCFSCGFSQRCCFSLYN